MSPKRVAAPVTRLGMPARAVAGKVAMRKGGSHFVYVVHCSDGSYYTGYTTDPERRLWEHNAGAGAKYTRGRVPVQLVFLEAAQTRGEALKRENEIKRMGRGAKEALVHEYGAAKNLSSR